MNLSLAISPCPNDTFAFDALIHHKIDTEGLSFEVQYEDIETLNKLAFSHGADVIKVSSGAMARAFSGYTLMDSGAAMGFGTGPLVIARTVMPDLASKIKDLKVGIPGYHTTANQLLDFAFPQPLHKIEFRFSDIENALLNHAIDLGVIIHENRFTYQQKGLAEVLDLGKFWETKTGLPIPLAGIMVKKSLATSTLDAIDRVLKRSIAFAFENPESSKAFVRSHAQELDESVTRKHIELYVNAYSLDMGKEGRQAFETFFSYQTPADPPSF